MKDNIKNAKKLFVDSLNGMALGLFSSLIIGLILKQIGDLTGFKMLTTIGLAAQRLMGPAIGAGVAYSLKASPLGIFASMVAGALGAGTVSTTVSDDKTLFLINIGEPVGAYVSAMFAAFTSKFISGKTKVDIVLVPALTIIAGGLSALYISPFIADAIKGLGVLINEATKLQPLPMGILISVVMGVILTLPISSAAIAISLGLSGLAAGAATVGCCCQMIGFAVSSYRENKTGGLIAQGLGTSMIQIPNIVRNPLIWIPPTLASAFLGPIATTVFKMENISTGAGMGTSGLVGQFSTYAAMGSSAWPGIILLHFILPALISLGISEYMRKKGYIKDGDMALEKL